MQCWEMLTLVDYLWSVFTSDRAFCVSPASTGQSHGMSTAQGPAEVLEDWGVMGWGPWRVDPRRQTRGGRSERSSCGCDAAVARDKEAAEAAGTPVCLASRRAPSPGAEAVPARRSGWWALVKWPEGWGPCGHREPV